MSNKPGLSTFHRSTVTVAVAIFAALICLPTYAFPANTPAAPSPDSRLAKAYRFQQGGWTYVHLEGSPAEIGFQHGYLLAPEIADALEAIKLFDTHHDPARLGFLPPGRPRNALAAHRCRISAGAAGHCRRRESPRRRARRLRHRRPERHSRSFRTTTCPG